MTGSFASGGENMSRDFPDIVDPWKAAEGKRSFQGSIPLERMHRLAAELAESGSKQRREAAFSAAFSLDRQGLVTIDISVQADLPLLCQRSLEVYEEKVDRRSLLAVIETVAEQEDIPEQYEPVLAEDHRLKMVDLVEEELLLAVPQVPRSPDAEAIELPLDVELTTSSDKENEPTQRPFAGLAGLMKTKAGE
jgi:uncharacterized protein